MKKNKNKQQQVISGKDLVIHSANKYGRHMDTVKSGTGKHKNVKTYKRKGKKVQKLKNSFRKGYSDASVFFLEQIFFIYLPIGTP